MHRVYNSAFMNMLKAEENAKYRTTIKNVLVFNHEILKRFVNFMNNPDEKTAVAQFGSQGKYFGACVLMATMPGLPMFGHGQIEGFREKYGMEYKRAYWDEQVDEGLVRGHEMWIFPLLRRRWLFSGSENFVLYDFQAGSGIDENVFVYSNRVGEHRALVLYNNCHAKTYGWISESVPFLAAGEGEGGRLERISFADSMGSPHEDDCYLAFRDLTDGLEYLRSGRELQGRGLYVELKEYQFNVFMDFREIRDDQERSWRSLYTHLDGSGSVSLEEQRKQLQYAELNAAFRRVFDLARDGEVVVSNKKLLKAVDTFLRIAAAEKPEQKQAKVRASVGKGQRKLPVAKSCTIELFAQFQRLEDHKSSATAAILFQERVAARFSDPTAGSLLLAWLILRETALDPVSIGLDCTLRSYLQREGDPAFSGRAIELLSALLAWWRSVGRDATSSTLKQMQGQFELEACQKFLLNHESDGVVWFNKERFEELAEWVTLLLLVEGFKPLSTNGVVSTRIGRAERSLQLMLTLAQDVGYRSRLFARIPDHDTSRSTGKSK